MAVIAGPTASGKSALAMDLAERLRGVVINADASQVYADLPILSAQPSDDEKRRVPHRLFGMMDGAKSCTATLWAARARSEIVAAHAEQMLPILVGGTGLYLRTLLEGIAPVPEIRAEIRDEIRLTPPESIRRALEEADPVMALRLHANDSQRNARALEVWRSTGRSLAEWHEATPEGGLGDDVQLMPMVIDIPREELVQRIDQRVDKMWAGGAKEEVIALNKRQLSPALPVMRAIGVPPVIAYLDGLVNENEMLERWKLDTRQYAKRQATWLRNQAGDWPRAAHS